MPAPLTGGQIFTYNLIRDLESCKSNLHIDVVCINNSSEKDIVNFSDKVCICKFPFSPVQKVFNILKLFPLYYVFSNRFSLRLLRRIKEIYRRKEYDLIILDHSQSFIYGLFFRRERKMAIAHDVISQRVKRQGGYIRHLHCKYSESFLLRKMKETSFYTFSAKDLNLLKSLGADRVSSTSFYPNFQVERINRLDRAIVLFGAWARPENLEGLSWFVDNVLSSIDKDIEIRIVGGGLPKKVKVIIEHYPNVIYYGFIEDPSEIISTSMLMAAPIFQGAGVKVKVIDSLALGTPVLGTVTAFEGISFDFKGALRVCESKEDFIRSINDYKISLEDKIELRKEFLEQYFKYKLKEDIVEYVEG